MERYEGRQRALKPDIRKFILAYLEKARRRLRDAEQLLIARSFDAVVSQAYYAMFYAATALLVKEGEWPPPRTHTGLVSTFGLRIVKEEKVKRGLGRALSDMERLRREANYTVRAFTKSEAEKAIETAKRFVEEIGILLEKIGC